MLLSFVKVLPPLLALITCLLFASVLSAFCHLSLSFGYLPTIEEKGLTFKIAQKHSLA